MALKDNPALLSVESYPLRFVTRVLYSDMDAFRHLNNGAAGRYFEEGRASLSIEVFGVASMIDPADGLQFLFVSSVIDYLRQAHYPGEVELGTSLSKIGNTSYVVTQGAFQNGECFAVAEGTTVKAFDGKPTPLTEQERAAMERYRLKT